VIYDSEHEANRKAFYSQFAQEIPDGMLATYVKEQPSKKNRHNYDALLIEFAQALRAFKVAEAALSSAEVALDEARTADWVAEVALDEAHTLKRGIEEKLSAYALLFGFTLPAEMAVYVGEEEIPF
jgi:hypothetical protein